MNPTQAARAIAAQFPDVATGRVEYLGEGCDSVAFEVDGRWVFRFPKRAEIEEQLLLESRVLPLLAPRSPVPIPEIVFVGRPSTEGPFHFTGYQKLAGEPGIRVAPDVAPTARQARTLGAFLSWLHQVPPAETMSRGVSVLTMAEHIEAIRAGALEDFETLHRVVPTAPLEAWHTYVTDGVPDAARLRDEPVVVHNDLAAEHVLCDSAAGEVTGIIDWSDMAIGDRALDVMAFWHWGGQGFLDAGLAAYGPIDVQVRTRARFFAVCRGIGDVVFGVDTDRPEYVQAGLRALDHCLGTDKMKP